MNKFFIAIAWFKTYFNSVASYLGIANFILLLLTFKSVYSINVSAWFIIPFALVIGLLVGYIDYHFVLKEQNTISNNVNDLKHQLNRIEEKLR